jgi:hypothetical protein
MVMLSAVTIAAVQQQVTVVGSSSFVVPSGVSRMTFKLWGAGGSSTGMLATTNGTTFAGGSGAFVSCDVTVVPGATIYLLVGQGGSVNNYNANSGNALGGGGEA